MHAHTRAMVAAAAFAILTGKKVAGVFDHSVGRKLRIAAECRGTELKAFDGDRKATFSGTLPELYDTGDKVHVSFDVSGDKITGHDRHTGTSYSAQVTDDVVQLFDYGENAWFSYDIQDPNSARAFHRTG